MGCQCNGIAATESEPFLYGDISAEAVFKAANLDYLEQLAVMVANISPEQTSGKAASLGRYEASLRVGRLVVNYGPLHSWPDVRLESGE